MIAHPAEVSNPGPKFSGRAAAPPDQGSIRSAAVMGRMGRQGTPAARTPAGMSFVTTLPEAMTAPSPMETPGITRTPPPIQTPAAHTDGIGVLQPLGPLCRVQGVAGGVESTLGADQHVVSKGHAAGVQNDAAVVHVEVPAHTDIPAVVAPEGRLNPQSFPSGRPAAGAAASGRIRCPPPDRPAD